MTTKGCDGRGVEAMRNDARGNLSEKRCLKLSQRLARERAADTHSWNAISACSLGINPILMTSGYPLDFVTLNILSLNVQVYPFHSCIWTSKSRSCMLLAPYTRPAGVACEEEVVAIGGLVGGPEGV